MLLALVARHIRPAEDEGAVRVLGMLPEIVAQGPDLFSERVLPGDPPSAVVQKCHIGDQSLARILVPQVVPHVLLDEYAPLERQEGYAAPHLLERAGLALHADRVL